MTSARIACLALMALVSLEAGAADPGFYFGIAGGRAKYDFDKLQVPVATLTPPPGGTGLNPTIQPPFPSFRFGSDAAYFVTVSPFPANFTRATLVSPFAIAGANHEDDDTSWSALVGYRVSKYLAAEVSYVALGELEALETSYVYPTLAPIQLKYTLRTGGGSVALLGILPLGDHWDIHLRAGGFILNSKLASTIGASRSSTTFGSEGLVYGIGTQFSFGEHWSVRLDFQRHKGVGERSAPAESDIDNLSLSVLYRL